MDPGTLDRTQRRIRTMEPVKAFLLRLDQPQSLHIFEVPLIERGQRALPFQRGCGDDRIISTDHFAGSFIATDNSLHSRERSNHLTNPPVLRTFSAANLEALKRQNVQNPKSGSDHPFPTERNVNAE